MWYLTSNGWQWYSKGHPKAPKFFLKRLTDEEYKNRTKNKNR